MDFEKWTDQIASESHSKNSFTKIFYKFCICFATVTFTWWFVPFVGMQYKVISGNRQDFNTKMKLLFRLCIKTFQASDDAPWFNYLPFTRKYNQRFDFLWFYWRRIRSDNNHGMMINGHSNWTNRKTRVHYPKSVSLSWCYVEWRHRKEIQKTFFKRIEISVISCSVSKFFVHWVSKKGVFKVTSSSIDHNPTWCSFLSIPMH